MKQRVTDLFGTEVPVVQAGMIWCSGWELAAAVSEAGGLGLIGAGSMYPEVLRTHIKKAQAATDKPFGVNLPLLYPDIEAHTLAVQGALGQYPAQLFKRTHRYQLVVARRSPAHQLTPHQTSLVRHRTGNRAR